MLVETVSERYLSFFVKLNILTLQLLMLGCIEAEAIAGADEAIYTLSPFRHNLAVSLLLIGKLTNSLICTRMEKLFKFQPTYSSLLTASGASAFSSLSTSDTECQKTEEICFSQ